MTRREIKPYRPRIQIPVTTMTTSPGLYGLYCLPVDGAEALLRIAPYLKREVTYIGQVVNEQFFLGPTEAELEAIRDVVGETEVGLMSGASCDDLVAALEAIQACVCALQSAQQIERERLPDIGPYVDEGFISLLPPSAVSATPTTPGTDEEKCEIAQAFFAYNFQLYTESLLPFASSTATNLLAALVATSWFSGVASGVGVPLAVATTIVSAVVQWGVDGSIADFTNWMIGSKDEIVCAVYEQLPDWDSAAAAVGAYIDAASELSFLEKHMLKQTAASAWHLEWVAQDQQDNGTWDAYIIEDYCDDCESPAGDCAEIDACYLPDWDGGLVACFSGRARITGGKSIYTKNVLTVPGAASELTLHWYPRATDYPTAKAGVWIREQGETATYALGNTADRAVDVLASDTFDIPLGYNGKIIELGISQVTWHCEPVRFCVAEK